MTESIDGLASPMKERVHELLNDPYAGSKSLGCDNPQAKYVSNCHGTQTYIFGLGKSSLKNNAHPKIMDGSKMEKLISKHFLRSDKAEIGHLIAFYMGSSECLLHTALLIGNNGETFHQSGERGVFEKSTIETELGTYRLIFGNAEVKYFSIKK
jgi:hypothetical protein